MTILTECLLIGNILKQLKTNCKKQNAYIDFVIESIIIIRFRLDQSFTFKANN